MSNEPNPDRILIVDDEQALVNILANVLRRRGYTVDTAADGEHGLALAVLHLPDVVLLDAHLPTIDGLEVCRELRSHAATREMSIIFLTGMSEDAARALTIEGMADGFLTKPLSLLDLLDTVRSAVVRRRRAYDRDGNIIRATPAGSGSGSASALSPVVQATR